MSILVEIDDESTSSTQYLKQIPTNAIKTPSNTFLKRQSPESGLVELIKGWTVKRTPVTI